MHTDPAPHKIKVKIVTPEKVILKDEYDQIAVPTTAGEIGILARHVPMVAELKPGEIRLIRQGKTVSRMSVSSGFIEARPHSKVVILADTAELAEEIDLQRAEEARQRVEQMLKEKQHLEDTDYARLQALLEKEMARIKVAKKHRLARR